MRAFFRCVSGSLFFGVLVLRMTWLVSLSPYILICLISLITWVGGGGGVDWGWSDDTAACVFAGPL